MPTQQYAIRYIGPRDVNGRPTRFVGHGIPTRNFTPEQYDALTQAQKDVIAGSELFTDLPSPEEEVGLAPSAVNIPVSRSGRIREAETVISEMPVADAPPQISPSPDLSVEGDI